MAGEPRREAHVLIVAGHDQRAALVRLRAPRLPYEAERLGMRAAALEDRGHDGGLEADDGAIRRIELGRAGVLAAVRAASRRVGRIEAQPFAAEDLEVARGRAVTVERAAATIEKFPDRIELRAIGRGDADHSIRRRGRARSADHEE